MRVMSYLKKYLTSIQSLMSMAVIILVKGYQICLSPYLPKSCRFMPSCSEYAIEAYQHFNVWQASYLTFRRLLRCHPFGSHGYDPLPLKSGNDVEFSKNSFIET